LFDIINECSLYGTKRLGLGYEPRIQKSTCH
jgi:hypothetical protein